MLLFATFNFMSILIFRIAKIASRPPNFASTLVKFSKLSTFKQRFGRVWLIDLKTKHHYYPHGMYYCRDCPYNTSPILLQSSNLLVAPVYISALASAPSRPPNPTLTPKTKLLPKTLVQKSQKLKKPGVLTVNIIPISHKSAKIATFSCQKSRVPNKIET